MWDYQPAPDLHSKLSIHLSDIYTQWSNEKVGKIPQRDKTLTPLFLVAGGQGIGKSRLLDEFQKEAIHAVDDPILKDKLESAYVFKVQFNDLQG